MWTLLVALAQDRLWHIASSERLHKSDLAAGIRREHSSDADGLSARFGLTLKLN